MKQTAAIIRQYLRKQRNLRRQQRKAGGRQVTFRPDYELGSYFGDILMFELEAMCNTISDN